MKEPLFPVKPVQVTYHSGMTVDELKAAAMQVRRDVIDISNNSGTRSGHLGGEMSVADLMTALYCKYLNLRPEDVNWPERDRFILSKGHNSACQYAAMSLRGILQRNLLFTGMNQVGEILQEHSNMDIPGIEAPTGSLGMGLANACGMAWAGKKKYGKDSYKAYVIMGDGECTEGQVWEAAGCAAQLKLDNVIAIIDYNKYIISDVIDNVMTLEPIVNRWEDFGWYVIRIDGNNMQEICDALDKANDLSIAPGKPRMIIADTKKGYPISFIMNDPVKWHSAHINDQQYNELMEELK